jgi:formylglycine-generating enzyme required for sulfatase activity
MMKDLFKNVWLLVLMIFFVFALSSVTFAATRVAVIPLGGAVGNATVSDVVKDKTFSTRSGKGLTGTLVLPPTMQTYTTPIYGMTFNLIPAGTFTMGSPADEPGRVLEETQHQVILTESFYMQTTEVTQQQWQDVVLAAESLGFLAIGVLDEKPSMTHLGVYLENYPVEAVSWDEIRSWLNALKQLTGKNYALPTEAQWEYAARATTTTAWAYIYSYDTSSTGAALSGFNTNLASIGWYFWNLTNSGYIAGTKPVAQKQPNKWGLYDMHGNVLEWCQDWYESYPSGTVIDPQGPNIGFSRVTRGGSWGVIARSTRSAARAGYLTDAISDNLGFRLVLPPGK